MAKEIKKTKKDFYKEILNYELTEDQKALIEHEIELLSKKTAKAKKVDAAAVELEDSILNVLCMGEGAMTCTEIAKALNFEFSAQKISAYLKKLKDANKVGKTVEKGKSYFSVIADITSR